MSKFLVIGLGNFGSAVARELARLNCRVTAIDDDREKVQSLQDQNLIVGVFGNATDRKILESLEVDKADCVIISTGKDSHASILITMYVSELGAKRIVVKANTRDHAKILMQVGATQAIIPEQEMAVKVSRSLAQPNLIDFLPMTGDYYVAELEAPEDFHNKNLAELQLRSKYNVQLIAVRKNNRRFEFAPGGDYVVEKNDLLIILGQDEDINRLKG